MIALMIVMTDEGGDLCFEITREEVVFQQDAVFQRLMPALDLALGLWMIRCAACVQHAFVFQVLGQFPRDVAGAIV